MALAAIGVCLALVLPAASTTGCFSSLDCSLNGDCRSGACVCDAAWSGSPSCDVLAVLSSNRSQSGYHNLSAASWGGNVLGPIQGKFHLFVAQMTGSCGLERYGSNSAIVRAEAPSPLGPFKWKQLVRHPFAHNPTVREIPKGGGYVIFFIGGNNASTVDCRNETRSAAQRTAPHRLVGGSIHAMHAPTVFGPWSTPIAIEFDDGGSKMSQWTGGGTNPSPVIEEDGSVTLALQREFRTSPPVLGNKELLGVARATSWRGPYTMITRQPVKPEHFGCISGTGEDPFMYRSRRGYHMVYHGMCPTGVFEARYAFSTDAATWRVSPRQAYSYLVNFTDASSELFPRMERPQLGFFNGASEAPTHLYNAVCSANTAASIYSCLELKPENTPVMTWTLARRLKPKQFFGRRKSQSEIP